MNVATKKKAQVAVLPPSSTRPEAERRGWKRLCDEMFGIDLRTLALVRVGMGLCLLCDLWIRGTDLVDHYTDLGVLPRGALLEKFAGYWELSIHWMTGTPLGVFALFLITAAAAVSLIVGYRTRLSTFIAWFLLISLQNRNPMVNHSGDVLFRMLLFWGLFLPLGARFSVDAALEPSDRPRPKRILSVATIALLSQVAMMYLFAAAQKTGPEWHREGSAVYYTLHIDQFVTPLGIWFRQFTGLLRVLTHVIFGFESLGPFLLFLPSPFTLVRLVAILGFFLMHMGFEAMLGIGIFPFFCLCAISSFVPSGVWDWLAGKLRRPNATGVTCFYDGECGFCRKMVLLVRELSGLSGLRVFPAQENEEAEAIMRSRNSWVVFDAEGHYYTGWEALAFFLDHSPFLFPFAKLMRLGAVSRMGERGYQWIASHRARLARTTAGFLVFRERKLEPGFFASTLVAFFLIYVFAWNLSTVPGSRIRMGNMEWLGVMLRIDQRWNMFSPGPLKDDGWYVIPGKLEDGRAVDVKSFSERPPVWEKPRLLSATFPNERWQKYMMNLMLAANSRYRLYYGQWLCRRWNQSRAVGHRLKTFEIYFMEEDTTLAGKKPVRKISLWKHNCF